jgi:sortase A
MRDRRPVDELTIEELERILAVRKREARMERLRHYEHQGRRVADPPEWTPPPAEPDTAPRQHEAAHELKPPEPPVTYDLTDDIPRFEDEPDTGHPARLTNHRRKRKGERSPTWDKLLLGIEVAAILGLAAVLILGIYLVMDENEKIDALAAETDDIRRDAALLRATPTPAPELALSSSKYVLPGGHYSPDLTNGYGVFNYTELMDALPENVSPQAIAQITAPQATNFTPQSTSPIRIVVDTPEVKIDASIFGGDDWYALQKGVGHWLGSATAGQDGNMVLSAHNDIYGETFRYIEKLKPSDEIRVMAQNGVWYTYQVREKVVVDPTDVWVLDQTSEPTATLITCHPYRVDTQRMVVFADLTSAE